MTRRIVGTKKRKKIVSVDRLHIIGLVFFLLALVTIARLFHLQILEGTTKFAEAFGQRARYQELIPERGEIFTMVSGNREQQVQDIAVNEQRQLLYAVPREIQDPGSVVSVLGDVLREYRYTYIHEEGIPETAPSQSAEETEQRYYEELLSKLDKPNDPYEPILHALDEVVSQKILSLELPGIYTQPEQIRHYPLAEQFAHITGFLGFYDDRRVGQYGIEAYFDSVLTGTDGYVASERDPAGRLIVLGDRTYVPATDGADVVLTIDPNIQQKACALIESGREKYDAESGSIVVMDPTTGALRALCITPSFDPNNYSAVNNYDVFINTVASQAYEPGSIFKPITMAAALDSGSVKADTIYEDIGEVIFNEYTIKNADEKIYGRQTMTQVIEKSINTGMVFTAMQTGRDTVRKYIEAFGFGSPTGIQLPAEAKGDISSLRKSADIYLATASFGQGISVTPLQMIQAYGAIANQGTLVRPYIVAEIQHSDGTVLRTEPQRTQEVITPQTAAILSAMLVNVIEQGHGTGARVEEFFIAGKTGTAQIAGKNGGYSGETTHSFAGFGPVIDPKFVMLVKLDKPKRGQFSASTVAPIFGELARFLLHYYQIPPER